MGRHRPPVKSRVPHAVYVLALAVGTIASAILAYEFLYDETYSWIVRRYVLAYVLVATILGALLSLGLVGIIDGLIQLAEITAQTFIDRTFPTRDD